MNRSRLGHSVEIVRMKALVSYVAVFGLLLLLLLTTTSSGAEETKYTTKYDDLDIDSIIKNERLLNSYVGCLLDRKPCTPDATELKVNLPDALANECSRCSVRQRQISDKLSHHLIDHRPEDWQQLEAKYDPTGTYRRVYLSDQQQRLKAPTSATTDA
ncbi:ejaculatory bulb-specific protein 3-like [Trichogramma pretiosum]|uniref:ejaculatory bulb-specific protein 3-like n=1 Tax=Trichogramma pretiosum TaxID=7493 RepID=UPI0006C9A54D|nr:ejaculatory bulb-specific protein 3-like [Trichogramma pretiosum]